MILTDLSATVDLWQDEFGFATRGGGLMTT